MNLDNLVGRLMMIGIPGPYCDRLTREILAQIRPGTVILFSKNIRSPEQVKSLTSEIRQFLGYEVLFAIDQEGGIVSRLRDGFSVSPGAMAIAATGNSENARMAGKILGMEMRAVGIDLNLAPVVDINSNPSNPGIGVRSYGDTPERVLEYSRAFVEGLRESGCLSCLKHFPGKGRVDVDAHIDLPTLSATAEELDSWELIPFKQVEADSLMSSHVFVPALQSEKGPCTVSREVLTGLLREKLGYKGLVFSDDMGMGGLTRYIEPAEGAAKALKAGNNVLIYCHNPEVQFLVKKTLLKALQSDEELLSCTVDSNRRFDEFLRKSSTVDRPPIEVVGSKENLSRMREIAESSITVISEDDPLVPLDADEIKDVLAVRLSRRVMVEDGELDGVPSIARRVAEAAKREIIGFESSISVEEAAKLAGSVSGEGLSVIFTENAHLSEGQSHLVQSICRKTKRSLVIALRNPYDAFIEGVQNAVLSFGYEHVSQLALEKVLFGLIEARGKLPVVRAD